MSSEINESNQKLSIFQSSGSPYTTPKLYVVQDLKQSLFLYNIAVSMTKQSLFLYNIAVSMTLLLNPLKPFRERETP